MTISYPSTTIMDGYANDAGHGLTNAVTSWHEDHVKMFYNICTITNFLLLDSSKEPMLDANNNWILAF